MKSMTTIQELTEYARKRDETYFLEHVEQWEDYLNRPRISRPHHYESLFNALGIDLKDKDVFELGPGWGALLEYARDSEAALIEFIDYNPYVYTYNRIRGFTGFIGDYFSKKAFQNVKDKYDVIVSRGSINLNRFERQYDGSALLIDFPDWLDRVESLCKKDGVVIISPTYDKGDDPDRPYFCNRYNTIGTRVYKHIMESGYMILPNIPDWYDDLYFPFTFVKRM